MILEYRHGNPLNLLPDYKRLMLLPLPYCSKRSLMGDMPYSLPRKENLALSQMRSLLPFGTLGTQIISLKRSVKRVNKYCMLFEGGS